MGLRRPGPGQHCGATVWRPAGNRRHRAYRHEYPVGGAVKPIAGVVTALTLLVILLFAAPLASYIPLAVLAAGLIVVAYNMGDWVKITGLPGSDANRCDGLGRDLRSDGFRRSHAGRWGRDGVRRSTFHQTCRGHDHGRRGHCRLRAGWARAHPAGQDDPCLCEESSVSTDRFCSGPPTSFVRCSTRSKACLRSSSCAFAT